MGPDPIGPKLTMGLGPIGPKLTKGPGPIGPKSTLAIGPKLTLDWSQVDIGTCSSSSTLPRERVVIVSSFKFGSL